MRSPELAPTKDPERITRRALLRGSAVAWELVSDGMTIITGKEQRYPDLRIRIWAGSALLDELTLIDDFDATVNAGVGRGVTHMPVFIEASDRSVLWVEHEKREDHRNSSHAEIFGFFEGKLRSFLLEAEVDDIDKVLAEPVHEEWARLGANGLLGYTKALDAIVRGTQGDDARCDPLNELPR